MRDCARRSAGATRRGNAARRSAIDLLDDANGSLFDAAVALVMIDVGVDLARLGEGAFDLGAQGRLVGFGREWIVAPASLIFFCDFGVGCDGVDGDERPAEAAAFRKSRLGPGSRRVHSRLVAEHEAVGRGDGRDRMQRRPVVGAMSSRRWR